PFVAAALTRREAVWPGEAPWLDAPVALPLLVADRCPAFVVADRPADAPDGEALHLLGALGSMAAGLLDCPHPDPGVEDELAELQHIDRLKTDFLGIASHELRTPIAVVHGIASTLYLRGPELTAEQVLELRGTLYEQTTRLVALAQALLDLSRIEAGAPQAQPPRLNPPERTAAPPPPTAPAPP